MRAEIRFDGGCRPTNPGNKYGSYSINLDDQFSVQKCRFELGFGTSNESEFDSLLAALDELIRASLKANVPLKDIRVKMFTDSTIVCNWIKRFPTVKVSKIKDARRLVMHGYAKQCVDKLNQFHSHEIQWHGRENSVAIFGH